MARGRDCCKAVTACKKLVSQGDQGLICCIHAATALTTSLAYLRHIRLSAATPKPNAVMMAPSHT
jgi:hypothetical protein